MLKKNIKHVFCILFIFLISCQSEQLIREKFQLLENREEITVVIFGDSISGGRFFSETGTSYGSFLKPQISELLGCTVSMIVANKDGDTYKRSIRRIQEDIFSFRPDIVFVMLGFVDSSMRGLYEQVFREHTDDFFKTMQNNNVFIILNFSF